MFGPLCPTGRHQFAEPHLPLDVYVLETYVSCSSSPLASLRVCFAPSPLRCYLLPTCACFSSVASLGLVEMVRCSLSLFCSPILRRRMARCICAGVRSGCSLL